MGLSKGFYQGGLTCSFSVLDLDKSIQWYTEVLGLEMLYKVEEMAWCELSSPVAQVNVGLSQVEELKNVKGNAVLTWGVADIDKARKELEKHDVKFDGETQTVPGMVKFCSFFDPDDNCLMLFQDISAMGS